MTPFRGFPVRLLLLLGPVASLAAQAPPPPPADSIRLADLVVSATRSAVSLRSVGSSITRLDGAELGRRQIHSLRDALRLAPGGTVLVSGGAGGVASLFLRGTASGQTLLLLDGVRVNDANAGYGSLLGGLDLAGSEAVEVVRGPQSTLYGGAAIGGVVALRAERGAGRPHAEADLRAGSFATWTGRVRAAGSAGGFAASLALTADGTENQRRPNTWRQRTQLVRLDYRLSPGLEAGASYRGLEQEYESPGDLRTSNTTPASHTDFDNHLATVWVEASPRGPWRSRLVAGIQHQVTRDSSAYDGAPFAFGLRHTRRVADWQHTLGFGPRALLLAGITREWNRFDNNGQDLDERLWAGYGELRFFPARGITLSGGVRGDDYSSFGRAATWRMTGAWWLDRSRTKLRATAGTGFLPPSLAARFGSVYQNPNPDIRPERSRSWDAGLDQEFFGGRVALSATWFHTLLRDLIGFESAPYPELGRNVNLHRARTRGLELGGRVSPGPLDARIGYTLLSARLLHPADPAEARLIRRPRHTLVGDLVAALSERASLGAGIQLVAGREDTDFNQFPAARVNPGDYAIVRLYGAWEPVRGLGLRLAAENLLDRHYEPVYGFPALGRTLTGTVALRLR
jgi:vitamin B12 transporter